MGFNCESPIEFIFAEQVARYCDDSISWQTQRPISTREQNHRVDFYTEAAGRKLVIECDGREFHEFWRDRARDVRMLVLGGVTDIIRFRGSDLKYAPDDCVTALRKLAPYLFRPDADPPTLESTIVGSMGVSGLDVKPILRARHWTTELLELPRWMKDVDTYTEIVTARDGTLGQFKSPFWDWTYRGCRAESFGSILSGFVDN